MACTTLTRLLPAAVLSPHQHRSNTTVPAFTPSITPIQPPSPNPTSQPTAKTTTKLSSPPSPPLAPSVFSPPLLPQHPFYYCKKIPTWITSIDKRT
mmetsp:Transcript_34311/g.45916  ORF Transcript_34311/g.45916 Transcript_34311/m.45916 type:complete len:96 (-) Transcript_34311:1318-1605(-)